MFVAVLAATMGAGCSQRHILRMSNPEQATMVTLFDRGEDTGEGDDTVVVVDERPRIARAASFFEARAERWNPSNVKPAGARYHISFRTGDNVSDRFWLDGYTLGLTTPSGEHYTCDITESERAKLLKIFQPTESTASSRSTALDPPSFK